MFYRWRKECDGLNQAEWMKEVDRENVRLENTMDAEREGAQVAFATWSIALPYIKKPIFVRT